MNKDLVSELDRLVPVKLFKDNERYTDDVFVSVNGNAFQIQRGVEVMVPMYIKLELDRAEEQRKAAEYYCSEGWKDSLIVQQGK